MTTLAKVYIRRSPTWEDSRARVLKALGDLYCEEDPNIILNFSRDNEGDLPNCTVLNENIEIMKNKILMNKLLDDFSIPHPKTFYHPFKRLPRSKKKECVTKYEYGECGNPYLPKNQKINKKETDFQ